MKKSFFEQALFVLGSVVTCLLILASTRVDLSNLASQTFESKVNGLNALLQAGCVSSTPTASISEKISTMASLQLSRTLPANWMSFLNSSLLANFRDQLMQTAQGTSDGSPVGGFDIDRGSETHPIVANCSIEEIRHVIHGDMTSTVVFAGLQSEIRSDLNEVLTAETLQNSSRLAQYTYSNRSLLDLGKPQSLASQFSTGLGEIAGAVPSIVVVEHRCNLVDPSIADSLFQPSTEPVVSEFLRSTSEMESVEATLEHNDAPNSATQNIASASLSR